VGGIEGKRRDGARAGHGEYIGGFEKGTLVDTFAAIACEEVLGVDEVDLILRRDGEHIRVGWVPLDAFVGVTLDGRHGHKQERGDVIVHQLWHLPDDEPTVGRYSSESVAGRDEVDDG